MATDTRDRILDASGALFQRQGFTGTGIKQILADAHAPFSSLYHFFPGGKDELGAESIRLSGEMYRQLVLAVFDAAPDLLTGIHDCFAGAAETLRVTDYADACPIATVALEVASINEPLRLATAEVFASWITVATSRYESAGITEPVARELADRDDRVARRRVRPEPRRAQYRADGGCREGRRHGSSRPRLTQSVLGPAHAPEHPAFVQSGYL